MHILSFSKILQSVDTIDFYRNISYICDLSHMGNLFRVLSNCFRIAFNNVLNFIRNNCGINYVLRCQYNYIILKKLSCSFHSKINCNYYKMSLFHACQRQREHPSFYSKTIYNFSLQSNDDFFKII